MKSVSGSSGRGWVRVRSIVTGSAVLNYTVNDHPVAIAPGTDVTATKIPRTHRCAMRLLHATHKHCRAVKQDNDGDQHKIQRTRHDAHDGKRFAGVFVRPVFNLNQLIN